MVKKLIEISKLKNRQRNNEKKKDRALETYGTIKKLKQSYIIRIKEEEKEGLKGTQRNND